MSPETILYAASVVIILWGIAHIAPTASVLKGFGDISRDNKLIVVQTWVSEGLMLVFVGAVVIAATASGGAQNPATRAVVVASGVMLVAGAIWHIFTGSRLPVIPMKICPALMTVVGICYFVALAL